MSKTKPPVDEALGHIPLRLRQQRYLTIQGKRYRLGPWVTEHPVHEGLYVTLSGAGNRLGWQVFADGYWRSWAPDRNAAQRAFRCGFRATASCQRDPWRGWVPPRGAVMPTLDDNEET